MKYLLTILITVIISSLNAQQIDLLLKGGHVIDPKNNINSVQDVAIADGKVFQVAVNISTSNAEIVVDASGMYVVPGLIDIHSHNFFGTESTYLSNGPEALPPDGFSFKAGVTTIVDVGGAGWRNFENFKSQTIDNSKTRVLSFLNIVGSGMKGGVIEQNMNDMDAKLTALVTRQYPEYIVGVKLAHYSGVEWKPTETTVEAGRLADIPVMIDFGDNNPPLSIETLLMEKLRLGDILTHAYAHVDGREPIVDDAGKLRDFILEAQERGIIFDVGHGGGSFVFEQAIPAIKQGLKPNTISTDLHTGSMNGAMRDQSNGMSKLMNIGLPYRK